MPSIDVVIELSAAQCRAHYAGAVANVYAPSVDGRRVLLPARALRQVVGRDGVHGVYRLSYDDTGRFLSLDRLRDT
jgi:hypothetical protein